MPDVVILLSWAIYSTNCPTKHNQHKENDKNFKETENVFALFCLKNVFEKFDDIILIFTKQFSK